MIFHDIFVNPLPRNIWNRLAECRNAVHTECTRGLSTPPVVDSSTPKRWFMAPRLRWLRWPSTWRSRLDEVDELVLQNKLLQVPNEVRKLQEYDIIWRHFLHGKFLPLFSFGFVISICSISLGLKTGIIAGAAMDVVENEAPFFFRSRSREGGVWLESGHFGSIWIIIDGSLIIMIHDTLWSLWLLFFCCWKRWDLIRHNC